MFSLVCSDLWTSCASARASSFATDCRRRQGMLSGPAAFRWFSDAIYTTTDLCNALTWAVVKSVNCVQIFFDVNCAELHTEDV